MPVNVATVYSLACFKFKVASVFDRLDCAELLLRQVLLIRCRILATLFKCVLVIPFEVIMSLTCSVFCDFFNLKRLWFEDSLYDFEVSILPAVKVPLFRAYFLYYIHRRLLLSMLCLPLFVVAK